jgi:myo-inositol-1(or 4)-monophosphatase
MARLPLTIYHRLAVSAAKRAGRLLTDYRGHELRIQYKGEANLVTEADQRAEQMIVELIRDAYPDHRIVAEEGSGAGPADATSREPIWFIDPLDGTTNFAHGFPFYCVSIGLEVEGRMMVGVVYDPVRRELFSAIRGKGAFCNRRRLRVSSTEKLGQSLLVTGFAYDVRSGPRQNFGHFYRFSTRCRGVRRTGAAALDLCYVADSRLDGFWELNLAPWDTAAGSLILEEAGGRLSNFGGGLYDIRVPELVASNGRIHEEMLDVLRLEQTPVDPTAPPWGVASACSIPQAGDQQEVRHGR